MPFDDVRADLNRAGDALRRLVDLASHRSGAVLTLMNEALVTLPQVVLLNRVEQAGVASLSDLAEGSAPSMAALSQMVERLVQQDLLHRAEDPADRRRKVIGVTSRASALLRRLEAARSAEYGSGLAALSAGLREQLLTVLERAVVEIEHARRVIAPKPETADEQE